MKNIFVQIFLIYLKMSLQWNSGWIFLKNILKIFFIEIKNIFLKRKMYTFKIKSDSIGISPPRNANLSRENIQEMLNLLNDKLYEIYSVRISEKEISSLIQTERRIDNGEIYYDLLSPLFIFRGIVVKLYYVMSVYRITYIYFSIVK